ncbi:MAG: Fic family protein [Candidatus Berkelbacteria bacterium]|nr:Fic family protein [Candidatus Berkelbacteria bacterium]
MFEPKFNITSKLLENIKRIGVIVADLNNRHFSKLTLVKLEKTAREVSAHSSTSIEGNPLPLTDVKKIIKNRPENLRDSEKEVINYNQALEVLDADIQNNTIKFNLDLILKTQKIVTRELINDFNSGKIRQQPVFVNDPIARKAIYLPPDHQDVKSLLDDLIEYITTSKNRIDPLILAGIFHKQFVIIHPFIDGNGRTARLMTKVLLADMGLNTFNLFSFENYYNQNVSKYFENVGIRGNYYDLKDQIDFTTWLEYFTDGIIDELLRVSKILSTETISPETALKPYHQKILDYIKKNNFIADRDYAKLTNRAKPTRNKDFNKLIELGLIQRHGKGKATYYKLKN